MADPATSRRTPARTEISLQGVTTEDLLAWAGRVTSASPISSGGQSLPQWPDGAELELTDTLFMGIELTFVAAGHAVHTLAIFAEVPTDEERAVMEEQPRLRAL